jgi:choline dehydrogenase-like flavoprotein
MQPGQLPHVFQSNEFNANTWVDEKEVPYTYDPDKVYNWVRVRLFGGRSLFWSRQSFRLSDYEFKGKSHDGYGDDWPISLADLAPYYSRVEQIFRVSGQADGLPQYPDGNFIPDDSPWTGCMQRFTTPASKKASPSAKRAAPGRRRSRQLRQSPPARCLRHRQTPRHPQRRRAQLSTDKNTGLVNEAHFVDRLSAAKCPSKPASSFLPQAPSKAPACC